MRGLDWSNTAYVRLYRQDTATWKRLKWEAQAVYVLLQRHLDRAGCLPLEGLFPYEVVAEMTGVPEEICEQALQRLLAGGFVEVSHDALVDPEFLEREEATMSDAQRKRESRQRRRDSARTSHSVTEESRNVTEVSHAVTRGHDESHAVTPCFTVPCLALEEERDVGNPRTGCPTDLPTQEQIPGTPPIQPKKPPWATRAEIEWRIEATWASFLRRRETYYGRKGFKLPPGRPPTLTPDIREDIVRSLRVHDAELMTPESREEWARDSKTRAAGEGMYLNRWNLGMRDGAEGENGNRASRYLEPWRPWKIRKGRDPVDEFAQIYFEKRAAAEAAGVKT